MWDLTTAKCAYRKALPHTKRSEPWLVQGQKNAKGREVPVRLEWNPKGSVCSVLYPSHVVSFNIQGVCIR